MSHGRIKNLLASVVGRDWGDFIRNVIRYVCTWYVEDSSIILPTAGFQSETSIKLEDPPTPETPLA